MTTPAPGVHDVDEDVYRAWTGSLTASGAKTILDLPARYAYEVLDGNNRTATSAMEFGSIAHAVVLGRGDKYKVLDFDAWTTKAAKEAKAEAEAEGCIAIKAKDYAKVEELTASVAAHPLAAKLLTGGKAEQSIVWHDTVNDITKRSRFDYLPEVTPGERLIIADLKTTPKGGASPDKFERTVIDFDYHVQADFYTEGALTLFDVPEVVFLFVVVEKEPPYPVNVFRLSSELATIGAERHQRAVQLYKQCTESGVWPAYPPEVDLAQAPTWAAIKHQGDMDLWGAV